MNNTDIMYTLRAVEFMSHGIDVSSFDNIDMFKGFVNSKTHKYISKLSENVTDFLIKLDDDCKNILGITSDTVLRHDRNYKLIFPDTPAAEEIAGKEPSIILTKDILVETIRVLYNKKFLTYEGVDKFLLDPDLEERLKKIDAEFKPNAKPTGTILESLSKEKTSHNFGVITAAAYHMCPEIKCKMLDYFKDDHKDFNIDTLKDFEVIDDRIYIGISEADRYRISERMNTQYGVTNPDIDDFKYIVVSKNLYDYYFCSYGSEFQSCYSTTSTYKGWFGMFPYGTTDGHFIIYGTKDKAIKVGMTSESNKWEAPYMYFRCWGWASTDNKILLDKPYTNRQNLFSVVKDLILSKYFEIERSTLTNIRSSKECGEIWKTYSLRFYPDSVRVNDQFKFNYASGTRDNVGSVKPYYGRCKDRDNSLKNELDMIISVSDSFDPYKEYHVTDDGVLVNPKVCPKTHLLIDESETESKYAKYLSCPLESCQKFAVVTYIDGYFKLDTCTNPRPEWTGTFKIQSCTIGASTGSFKDGLCLCPSFSSREKLAIKPFKEYLKGNINNSDIDLLLLRYVDGDKVTYIKYKKTGVKA